VQPIAFGFGLRYRGEDGCAILAAVVDATRSVQHLAFDVSSKWLGCQIVVDGDRLFALAIRNGENTGSGCRRLYLFRLFAALICASWQQDAGGNDEWREKFHGWFTFLAL